MNQGTARGTTEVNDPPDGRLDSGSLAEAIVGGLVKVLTPAFKSKSGLEADRPNKHPPNPRMGKVIKQSDDSFAI